MGSRDSSNIMGLGLALSGCFSLLFRVLVSKALFPHGGKMVAGNTGYIPTSQEPWQKESLSFPKFQQQTQNKVLLSLIVHAHPRTNLWS